MPREAFHFRLLGPLEVTAGGRSVRPGAAKHRAVLAVLLLHRNESVSTDGLIDALWGEHPPASAHKLLQTYVWQLRRALGNGAHDLLLTRPPGYVLRVAADSVDVGRFERLLPEGRAKLLDGEAKAAAATLRAALGLWRGARLDELYLVAVESRIEADLGAGRSDGLVGELQALVAEHPLRERLREQLMLALYRSGRQAEALEAYRDARRLLRDELGIEPGSGLKRLEDRILRQDPELDRVESRPGPPVPLSESETRKPVTVVVADVQESLPDHAPPDPEARRAARAGYLRTAVAVLTPHGATLEEWPDGSIAALLGVSRTHEDDALRAVRAAVDLRQALTSAFDVEVRMAVETGEVLAADCRDGGHSVSGEVLARTSRLARRSRPGEIVLGDATRRLVGEAVAVEPLDGVSESPTWLLVELTSASVRPRSRQASLVGREIALGELRRAYERTVEERAPQLLTIVGDPGIGKSRLVREFAATLEESATVLVGRCLSYGEGITFWPLREIVEAAGGRSTDTIAELLGDDPDAEAVASRIAALVGLDPPAGPAEESFWAIRRLLETLAQRRPVVAVFEDVHWAEPTLLDLVENLGTRTSDAPVLVLCVTRPELLDERPTLDAAALELTPLADAEIRAIVDELAFLPAEASARVVEVAEGNPLFAEQLTAMLAEGKAYDGDLAVPPTIEALLAARLGRLGPGERAVIGRAAVIGREFETDAVAELLTVDARPTAVRHIGSLVRRGLVRRQQSGEAFRFAHVLIREAAYRAVPKRQRAELHERLAGWLARTLGDRASEYDELLGYHLEQAFRYRQELGPLDEQARGIAEQAADLLGAAGLRAEARKDAPAAVNLLSRAASLLPADDARRLRCLTALGHALRERADFARADAVLSEAVERTSVSSARDLHARALIERAAVRLFSAERLEEALEDAEPAMAIFAELEDDAGLLRGWHLRGLVHRRRYEIAPCREAFEHMLDHARRCGDRAAESDARFNVFWTLVDGEVPIADTVRYAEDLCRWVESTGDPSLETDALAPLAFARAKQGKLTEARGHVDRLRSLLEASDRRMALVPTDFLAGWIEMIAGDHPAAEAHYRRGYERSIGLGERWWITANAERLAEALTAQGRLDEVEALQAEAEAIRRAFFARGAEGRATGAAA